MNSTLKRKAGIYALILQLVIATFPPTALAALVQTPDAMAAEERSASLQQFNEALAREDVQQQLLQLGIDPGAARQRIAALTDAEIARLQNHLDTLPAGAGVLEVIGVVFVVLLILELVGVTNIFSKF
ncbi:MAG: PA2779 family protein [Gammaproteobacteria bacterium]|nr:PA2779 family protein [Gammaproteobacteria bacterium]